MCGFYMCANACIEIACLDPPPPPRPSAIQTRVTMRNSKGTLGE